MHAVCAPHAFAPQQPSEGSAVGCSAILFLLPSSAYRTQGGRAAPLPGPKARSLAIATCKPGLLTSRQLPQKPVTLCRIGSLLPSLVAILKPRPLNSMSHGDGFTLRLGLCCRGVLSVDPVSKPSMTWCAQGRLQGRRASSLRHSPHWALQSCSPYSPQLVSLLFTTALWPNIVSQHCHPVRLVRLSHAAF